MPDSRKVEVLRINRWEEISFRKLKSGDTFRLYEGDKILVTDDEDLTDISEWSATSDPYLNKDKVWTIDCNPANGKLENRKGE
jgi:hypothetical protein